MFYLITYYTRSVTNEHHCNNSVGKDNFPKFNQTLIIVYIANVLAVNSTFYFCVKNPPTVSCDFSRYLSVVYQDQYSAVFTEK